MKFNEKELAVWASMFIPDKEGLLEKRGAGLSHGYRTRWFRLKGNLMFYFKVDDNGDWQHSGDPLGVIVLERVSVDRFHNDSKPYTFVLNFEGDDSRAYFLTAYSESEMTGWIQAIQMASYEGLKSMLYKLQKTLTSLTGEDPLKDKHVSFIGPQVTPHKVSRQLHDAKKSLYIRGSNADRTKKLTDLLNTTSEETNPQYELSISCSSLPLGEDGLPPNTVVRVRSYTYHNDQQALATLGHTEIVQSSVSPNFSHLILLETGPLCPPSANLKFEIFSVNESQISSEMDVSCKLSLPQGSSSAVVLDGKCGSDLSTIELRKGVQIGEADCQYSAITSTSGHKELKLPLSLNNLVCGFVHIVALQVDDHFLYHRNALNPVDKCSILGYLPSIMIHPVHCHFSFPATISGNPIRLKVIEEMAESVFNIQVPIELLKAYIKEDTLLLEELNTIGALEDKWKEVLLYHQNMLIDSLTHYKDMKATLEDLGDTCGFKPSTQKKDPDLQMVLCNMHIQKIKIEHQTEGIREKSSYTTITSGCPADHVSGFKNGGLKKMLSECRSCPSFLSNFSDGRESTLNHTRARLREIKANIISYNTTLYRACANANPHNMNGAMIGISKEIQQLLVLMESDTIKDAIDALTRARPSVSNNDDQPNLTNPLGAPISRDSRHSSLKRKSDALPTGKCNCGKCSKCVPSPSDWVWNGSKFVQVSKEWKMADSSGSIQSSLCGLIENVEAATLKVVHQQHLAVAQEIGINIGTFKPTYVWSLDLIPMFARLNQTIEGLFKIASSSLSYATLLHDSYVHNIKSLKRRRDVVFSQALTSLVTSFYTVLNKNFLDPIFLKQIREIGFLVEYESLLSSLGDEIGMLEDMSVAVAELATVHFQLAEVRGEDDIPFDFRIIGTRDSLTVQFLISRDVLAMLPDEKLRQGASISVVPILFTQGINEKQTLANLKHDLLLQSSLTLQDDTNNRSMRKLSQYTDSFEKLLRGIKKSSTELQAIQVRDLHNLLQQSHSSQKSKNVEFLLTVQQIVHCMQGGRLTSCKSGKDRTGMAVTLEECCFLRNYHHLDSCAFSKALDTIRSHGTRLENCLKNTGHRCYHFNQLQLMLLPKLLTPPPFTCRDPE